MMVTKMFEVRRTPKEVYREAVGWFSERGYTLEEDIPNEEIRVKVGRGYSLGLLIALIILILPVALIYYFMCRKRDRILISLTKQKGGTLVTASFEGRRAEEVYHNFVREFPK